MLKAEGIGDKGITAAKLADGAVTSAKIAANAVTSAKIADGAVATADLANGAVTKGKIDSSLAKYIQDGAVLASPSWYMSADHTVTLAQKVSAQAHGIVLVWSAINNGVADNYDFSTFFVPKQLLAKVSRAGVIMTAEPWDRLAMMKYVYVSDGKIEGHAGNVNTGTATSGTKYANNLYVLRWVIGV